MHVFNSSYLKYKDESRAFATASGVLSKQLEKHTEEEQDKFNLAVDRFLKNLE